MLYIQSATGELLISVKLVHKVKYKDTIRPWIDWIEVHQNQDPTINAIFYHFSFFKSYTDKNGCRSPEVNWPTNYWTFPIKAVWIDSLRLGGC